MDTIADVSTTVSPKKASKCHLKNCAWSGPISRLLHHVSTKHQPSDLIVYSYVQQHMTLDRNVCSKCLIIYPKNYYRNIIYWLTVHDDHYVTVLYEGQVGIVSIENTTTIKHFSLFQNGRVAGGEVMSKNHVDVKQHGAFSGWLHGPVEFTFTGFGRQVLSHFECDVCCDLMYPPIRICVMGHSICNFCCAKLNRGTCPTCRNPMSLGRNFALENVIEPSFFPCPNRSLGCLDNNTVGHLEICYYRKIKCCYYKNASKCVWEHSQPKFKNHVVTEHSDYLIECGQWAEFSKSSLTDRQVHVLAFDNAFVIRWEQLDSFHEFVVEYPSLDPSAKFYCDFEISGGDLTSSLKLCMPCQPSDTVPSAENMHTFHIADDVLENDFKFRVNIYEDITVHK